MFSSTRALAVAAALAVAGACAQTPTSPSATAGGAVVAEIKQTPASVPAAIVPSPQAVGATRFIAFGDSITCGVISLPAFSLLPVHCDIADYGYPERLLTMLVTYNSSQVFTVRKRGEPGETAAAGIARLTSELAELAGPSVPVNSRPQALLLLEGINDMGGLGISATRAASSVAQMVQIARVYNLTVLVATMYQTYPGARGENAADKIVPFNTELRRLVGGLQNVHIVDLYTSFGTNANGTYVGADGLHPTPAGYDRMAQKFHAEILAQFPVRGSLQ
jgi:lysophospholipase L1-like esterase